VPVSIYLVNGIKLQGQIDSFDKFVAYSGIAWSDGYKHANVHRVRAREKRAVLPTGEDGEADGTGDSR